jgi:hypothetical protein
MDKKALTSGSVKAVINVDQVGSRRSSDPPALKLNGDYGIQSDSFATVLKPLIEAYSEPLVSERVLRSSTLYSDHIPFFEAGCPVVALEEWTRTPHYHTTLIIFITSIRPSFIFLLLA